MLEDNVPQLVILLQHLGSRIEHNIILIQPQYLNSLSKFTFTLPLNMYSAKSNCYLTIPENFFQKNDTTTMELPYCLQSEPHRFFAQVLLRPTIAVSTLINAVTGMVIAKVKGVFRIPLVHQSKLGNERVFYLLIFIL